ncbi:MAG: hypothetical protein JJK57_06565 [Komagataeibacter hansenii]|nr:hypothetical protein [Novacetimonas hansenii]
MLQRAVHQGADDRLLPPERVFENNALIKNKESFWVLTFSKKAVSSEAFWKKLHQKLL